MTRILRIIVSRLFHDPNIKNSFVGFPNRANIFEDLFLKVATYVLALMVNLKSVIFGLSSGMNRHNAPCPILNTFGFSLSVCTMIRLSRKNPYLRHYSKWLWWSSSSMSLISIWFVFLLVSSSHTYSWGHENSLPLPRLLVYTMKKFPSPIIVDRVFQRLDNI